MRKILISMLAIVSVFIGAGLGHASLTTIGTATLGSIEYNLIWDDDNNGKSVIWLDYTNIPKHWLTQRGWAIGLDASITSYNIDPQYEVTWVDSQWRLPDTGTSPQWGYNQSTSEMGHLYYVELGLESYEDRENVDVTDAELNSSNFDNLVPGYYWTGSVGNYAAWAFNLRIGYQGFYDSGASLFGMAVRSADVSTVPIPGSLWLLGSGIIGLMVRKFRKPAAQVRGCAIDS